jgi:dipeptidyl aminopeptidase/acylaminoacyl peptidase
MNPRISPDGHTLAFLVFAGELTQVAIMKPETGNWTILTRNSERGYVQELSWSKDGTRIYYDRNSDVSYSVFSVPVFGGDEHVVLQDAECPQGLPDGSLLVFRWNAQHREQLFRYWPETGQLHRFPVEIVKSDAYPIPIRVSKDGRSAVMVGRPILPTPYPANPTLLLVDLVSRGVRVLDNGALPPFSLALSRNGKSILTASTSGDLSKLETFAVGGAQRKRTILTATHPMHLDIGPDGAVYADEVDRPSALVRFSASGGAIQKINDYGGDGVLLPDGRVVVTGRVQGRNHLMGLETGKNPVLFVNTGYETFTPATALGRSEIAFLTAAPSPKPHREVAIADISNGTISRRFAFDKGRITSLAATPDGKTLFIAAGGNIWSVPLSGGEPRVIRAGDSMGVDPSGKFLLVQVIEAPKVRLIKVPLDGAAEQEIRVIGPYRLSFLPITSQTIGKDGRLVVSLTSPDSRFVSPGIIDLATGQATRIPVEHYCDYLSTAWAPDGSILSTTLGLRSSLWRFQEASR